MTRSLPFAIAASVLLSACAHGPWQLAVPQPGYRPVSRVDAIGDYRTAAATIASIFEKDLGFAPFPAIVHFFPDRGAFERGLLAVGYDPTLARRTAGTMTAVGGYRGVMLNEAALGMLAWDARVALLAHELGHSLQYELGGGRRGTSDQWLREGFAEWVSIRVLERLDGTSLVDVRRDRLRELRAAGRSRTPPLTDLVTFPQWVDASGRRGTAVYALSFLGVDFLLERHGVPAVLGYFRRFAASEDRAGHFRAAFGEDLAAFEAALGARLWGRAAN